MSSEDISSIGRQFRQIADPRTRGLFERIANNIDIIKEAIALVESPSLLGWRDVQLLNNWVQFSDQYFLPQYTITNEGLVLIRGRIKSGTATSGTALFNLLKGFRPEKIAGFAVDASPGSHGSVNVQPDGNVVIISGNNTYLTLDGIIFEAYR